MSDARSKAIFITFLFFVSLLSFSFVKAASAATYNNVMSCPSVQADSTGAIGGLNIVESPAYSLKQGDSVSVNLSTIVALKKIQIQETSACVNTATIELDTPASGEFTISDLAVNVSGAVYKYGAYSYEITGVPGMYGSPAGGAFSVQITADDSFSIMVNQPDPPGGYYYYNFLITFPSVYIKPLGPNDPTQINATIDAPPGSGFSTSAGSYVPITLANIALAGTTASVDAPLSSASNQTYIVPTLGQGGGNVAPIIIKETAPGSLKVNSGAGGGTVYLSMPPGFTWSNVNVVQDWGFNANDPGLSPPGPDVSYQVITDTNGLSVVSLIINGSTSSTVGRITITGDATVDLSAAQPGDVLVTYYGTNLGVVGASLTVAKYIANGVATPQGTTSNVIAGRQNQQVGQFLLQEQTAGDFPQGRTVTFTLPDGAYWHTIPTVLRQAGDGVLSAGTLNSDNSVLSFSVTQTSTVASEYAFENGSVDLAVYNPGALAVTVAGPGIATGTETIANILQPLALTANGGTVTPGQQGQAVGNITLAEESTGVLLAKDSSGNQAVLTLTLPAGFTFSQAPTLALSGGNLDLATASASIDATGRVLTVPVNQSSTIPSTITISVIKVNADQTVPEGDVTLDIGGTAIAQTSALFPGSLDLMQLVIASCPSAGAGASAAGTAVFTIGQSSYTQNGQSVTMDVAPFIENGRTMVPLRYAANAVGITGDNIVWNSVTNSVTLIKGGSVIQMQIGSAVLQMNGVQVPIDVAPEISSGRTMLPVRALGTALGATLQWNATNQTVTVSSN